MTFTLNTNKIERKTKEMREAEKARIREKRNNEINKNIRVTGIKRQT